MKGQDKQALLRFINEGRQYDPLRTQEASGIAQTQTFSLEGLRQALKLADKKDLRSQVDEVCKNPTEGLNQSAQFVDEYERFAEEVVTRDQGNRMEPNDSLSSPTYPGFESMLPPPLERHQHFGRPTPYGFQGSCRSDWKDLLDDWLMPVDKASPVDAIRPVGSDDRLAEVEASLAEEKKENRALMDKYFRESSKAFTLNCLTDGGRLSGGDAIWWNLDHIDPFRGHQEYKFLSNESLANASSSSSHEDLLREGLSAYAGGDVDRAVELLESAVRKERSSSQAWYGLGLASAASGSDGQAVCAFKEYLSLESEPRPNVYLELASCFVNEGLHASACQMLCLWLCSADPERREEVRGLISGKRFGFFHLNEMPRSLVCSRDLGSLREVLASVVRTSVERSNPGRTPTEGKVDSAMLQGPDVCTWAALVHVMESRPGEAGRYLRCAVSKRPGDPKLWNKLGAVMVEHGDYGQAAEAFRRALEIWPCFHKVRCNLASLCMRVNLYREAAQHLQQVLARRGREASLWRQLGRCVEGLDGPDLRLTRAWREGNVEALSRALSSI